MATHKFLIGFCTLNYFELHCDLSEYIQMLEHIFLNFVNILMNFKMELKIETKFMVISYKSLSLENTTCFFNRDFNLWDKNIEI